jgi:copper transport protein
MTEAVADQDAELVASTARIVDRFSTMASVALVAITLAGLALSVELVGSPSALFTTGYGRLLLVKVALVAVVVGAAVYNHFVLLAKVGAAGADHDDGTPRDTGAWRVLRRTVRIEAGVLVMVLIVTGVLTNTTPAVHEARDEPVPFEQSQPFEGSSATLVISPNHRGPNTIEVRVTGAGGQPMDIPGGVTVALTLPERNVGPIVRDLPRIAPGHHRLEEITDLAIAGEWTVDVTLRTGDFDQERLTYRSTVR